MLYYYRKRFVQRSLQADLAFSMDFGICESRRTSPLRFRVVACLLLAQAVRPALEQFRVESSRFTVENASDTKTRAESMGMEAALSAIER
jgi:hypothetical protein